MKVKKQPQIEPQIDQKWKIANMEKPNIFDYFEPVASMHKTNIEETEEFKQLVENHNEILEEMLQKDHLEDFNQKNFFP